MWHIFGIVTNTSREGTSTLVQIVSFIALMAAHSVLLFSNDEKALRTKFNILPSG